MKNLVKSIFALSVAALAFASCAKELDSSIERPSAQTRTVSFIAESIESKTVFGDKEGNKYPTLWTGNQAVGISLNFATVKQSSAPEPSSDGTTARFDVELEAGEASSFKFYAVSPYASVISVSNSYKSVQVDIPASQTPLGNSVDEKAQILVSESAELSTFPESVSLADFAHITAYGKVSFSNLSLADGEAIESISLTADENWAGRYYYYLETTEANAKGDIVANSAGKTITLVTTSSSDIWFACAPVDLGGKNIKAVVTTDKGTTYSKTITIPAGKVFASGKVAAFSIPMDGVTADAAVDYVLVKDAADLAIGSEIIIAGFGQNYALGTTQNANNRAAVEQLKSSDGEIISSPGAAVQILTLEAGNKANTFAFNTGDGYLYAASSGSNWLRTETDLSDNSSWSIEINGTTGEATLIAQGSNTRNMMRCNHTNNPPIFSCYASTATTGVGVALYMKAGSAVVKTPLAAPTNVKAEAEGSDVLVSWTDIAAPQGVTVTYRVACEGYNPQTIAAGVQSAKFEALPDGTYEISVTAVPSENDDYKESAAAVTSVTVQTQGGGDTFYTKVTSEPSDWSGQYLIVYEDGAVAFDGSLDPLDAVGNSIPVTISGGKIACTPGSNVPAAQFTIAALPEGGYSILSAIGKYIGQNSDANGLASSDSPIANTVSLDTDGNADIVSGGAYLRYNSASNQLRFRYYKSASYASQKAIALYKLDGGAPVVDTRTEVEMSFDPAGPFEITLGDSFEGPDLIVNPDAPFGFSVETVPSGIATINDEGELSITGAGTITVKVEVTDLVNYKPASASYTVVVKENVVVNVGTADNPISASAAIAIAQANPASEFENAYVKGIVCQSGSINTSGQVNYYVSDDGSTDSKFEMYKGKYIGGADFTDKTNLNVGDLVVATGTLMYYNGNQAEFKENNEVVSVFRAPRFSPAGGIYTEAQNVTLSAEIGATIYYTLDGSVPTGNSLVYSSPLSISATTTVRAIAVKAGVSSGVATTVYTINSGANDGSLEKPFTVSEAIAAAQAQGTTASTTEYYVKGIVSAITTAYNSQYGNVSFNISEDGSSTAAQFMAYREKSSYSSSVAAGDAVLVKGKIKNHNNNIPEFDSNCAIQSLLAKPVISGEENFSTSTSVTISAASGATIYYTLDGLAPTTSSSVYSAALNITATTTVKAIAEKDGFVTGIASKTFSVAGGGTTKTSSLIFTDKCNGSGTADDGAVWTVTSDGTESSYDSTKGIHYGTSSAQVQYIKLATSDIPGTITKVVVNASTASGVTASADVTVGGAAFGGNAQSLSSSAAKYTFAGSAAGEIIVTVTKPSKAAKAIYVKSIVVTYTD